MSQERIAYLDRMISKLREEQDNLMDEYQQLEQVICSYEKEADKLEALMNDEVQQMMDDVVKSRIAKDCNYGGTSD